MTKQLSSLDKRVNLLAARMHDVMLPELKRGPRDGMLPPEEIEYLTAEEMEGQYRMLWRAPPHKYGPDYFRLDAHRNNRTVTGNMALLGMFFWNTKTKLQMFQQQRVCTPFEDGPALTRKQWWTLLFNGMLAREALWCWLPGVIRATEEPDWRGFRCVGWDIYQHKYPVTFDDDVIIGPDGVFTRAEFDARQPKWKGISMFQDITAVRSKQKK